MTFTRWRTARRIVQVLSLLLFVAFILYTVEADTALPGADVLMRLDPLAGAAAMLSARRWMAAFVPAVILLGTTLLLGRFWCGWLCPLGTTLDLAPSQHEGPGVIPSRWRATKYVLVLVILLGALLGSLTLLILDPLTMVIRSVTTVIVPGLNWLITAAERGLYRVGWLTGPVDAIDAALRGPILSYKQPYYGGIWLLVGLLGGILALNWVERRAWCRHACPLGGLLSLVSRVSPLKRQVGDDCSACRRCARECRMGTVDGETGYASDSGECIACMDCAADCPRDAITFAPRLGLDRGHVYDPTRRQALGALGISLGGLALLHLAPDAHHPHAHRLRPPGADEDDLLAHCLRCGACVRACPTHGLQHAMTEAGLEGLWTPVLVPRLGHCDYACTACGDICPTGAIPPLDLATKRTTPIGKAYIDPAVCIAWSERGDCIVCEEMCPLPEKAIHLQEREIIDDAGNARMLQLPLVDHERCIGCGLCEHKCPVKGEAAIRVIVDPLETW
jgi:MauM/NapG family ferredoxin protein